MQSGETITTVILPPGKVLPIMQQASYQKCIFYSLEYSNKRRICAIIHPRFTTSVYIRSNPGDLPLFVLLFLQSILPPTKKI